MDPIVQSLAILVVQDRQAALCDAQWLARELQPLHPLDSRVYILGLAVREDLPRQLLAGGRVEDFARRLQRTRAIKIQSARWAAAAWYEALEHSGNLNFLCG